MIFSERIYKIINGNNPSLFTNKTDSLDLFIFDKSLKKYAISLDLNRKCVFIDDYNYKKLIQLNDNLYCVCYNDFISLVNKNEL